MTDMKFGFGQPVLRKEDDALLRGAGRYTADVAPPGMLHAYVLRSPHAHARFRITDSAAARTMPGVRLVLTAQDTRELGPMPCTVMPPGPKIPVPPYPVLAVDEVRHVGDAVAVVVADALDQAKDAAETIAIEWEARPHVVGSVEARKPGAVEVWPDRPGNFAFDLAIGDRKATADAFAKAAKVVELTVVNQRLVTNYLEPRAVIGEYDAGADRITLTLTSQGAHINRDILSLFVLKCPPEKLRVITPDVGGGFGTKLFPYREYALIAFAAKRLARPVAWVADRSEHFLADTQGRDNVTTAKLALDAQGKFLGLDVEITADMGAYLSTFAPYIPHAGAGMLPGVYDFPTCFIRVVGVYTHTLPVDAYRGAGRPEASYVLERLVDVAAREIGVAPDVLRGRNFIKPGAMPHRTPTGKTYDCGEFAAHLRRAQDLANWKGFAKRLTASKKAGRLRGIGIATYIEACGAYGPETATLRLEPDGSVTVLIGSQSTGQGHATSYAQIIADHLGLPPDRVTVVQGDTDHIRTGIGTGGSSSIPCGGASVAGAARKLADNLKDLAAEALESAASDLEIVDGRVRVAGTDRAVGFADLARSPRATPDRLTTEDAVVPTEPTYPNGTHLAEIEIDPATGAIAILNYVIVDDFGETLNPLMLAGQVHGGTAQGIGQAFMERTVYDPESGQLLTASLMDYALPRAADTPPFEFETRNVRSRTNVLGVKGAGEAGAIGSCPALMNAVADALWRAYRIRHIDMPATAERVWRALEEGKRLHTL